MIENLLIYIDIFSNLLPILFFITYWKTSSANIGIRIIILYNVLSFVINSIVTITSTTYTFLYESLTLSEFLLFAGFCYIQIKNKQVKFLILIAGILFTLFLFTYALLIHGVDRFDSVPIGVETIIILGFSFYFLYERMKETNTLFLYNKAPFWIILGIIIYLAGCFFIYIFGSYLTASQLEKYWSITNLFAFLRNLFFCIAIYIHAKPPKDSMPYDLGLGSLN